MFINISDNIPYSVFNELNCHITKPLVCIQER